MLGDGFTFGIFICQNENVVFSFSCTVSDKIKDVFEISMIWISTNILEKYLGG